MKSKNFTVVFTLLLMSCLTESKFISSMDNAIKTNEVEGEKLIISVGDLTQFGWDRLYIFEPYTPLSKIKEFLGVSSKRIEKTGINLRDDIHLLVFEQYNEIVEVITLPRSICDFDLIAPMQVFSRSEAIFEISNVNEWRYAVQLTQ